jgi:D-psicose/D-tagatose/L-ribulose 3-epimerase
MTFGINTFLFTSPFTNRSTGLFRKFKQWGFDGVEIAVEDPAHFDPVYVRKKLDASGLVCTSVCACFPPMRDLRGTRRQQFASVSYLRRLVDIADTFGTGVIAGPLYSATGRAEAVAKRDYNRHWKTVVRHLKTICDQANDRGKVFCLEPLNRFETDFINTVDQGLKLIDDIGSPALKLLLDTFHMNIEEKDIGAAIRRAGDRIGHIHASATDRGTPGNDHLDWAGFARALRGARYNGAVVIESFTTDVKVIARAAAIWRQIEPTRDDIARRGLTFLKKILK